MTSPGRNGVAPRPTPSGSGPRVVGNFLYLLIGQAVVAGAGLVSTALLARALGTEAYGILGFGTAMLSYFGLLVVFGTDVWGVRAMVQDQAGARAVVPRILGLRLVLLAALSVIYLIVIGRLGLPDRVRTVLVIQGLGLAVAAFTLDFVFQAVQRMGVIALRQILAAGLSLAAVVVLVRSPADLYVAAAIPPLAFGLSAVWLAFRMQREVVPFGLAFDPAAWRTILAAALPITIAQFMNGLFHNIDVVMLGFMAREHEVGLYVAMVRMMQMAASLGGLIVTAFTPVIAAAWPSDGAMRDRYRDLVTASMLFGAPVAAVGIAYPHAIIGIIFGDVYRDGAPALVLLLASAAISYAGIAATTALVAWHDQTMQMAIYGAGALTNILLNLFLIPRYGIVGAAIATLGAQLMITAGLGLRAFLRFRVAALAPGLKLAGCAAAAFAIVRGLDLLAGPAPAVPVALRFFLAAACGLALYVGLALLVRAVDVRRIFGFLAARFGPRAG